MKPEDLIQNLKDIHLPVEEQSLLTTGFAWWPLVVFGILLGLGIFFSIRRRTAWKRQIMEELNELDDLMSNDLARDAWQKLGTLLRRVALKTSPRESIAGQSGQPWLRSLNTLFKTDAFSEGEGQGVIHEPYVQYPGNQKREFHALIETLRHQVSHLTSLR